MENTRFYIGTYTEGTDSAGVYTLRFDAGNGTLDIASTFGACRNPSFLAWREGLLYIANESPEGGRITVCRAKGDALELAGQLETPGKALCHLALGPRAIYGANYASGNVVACPLSADGALLEPVQSIQHHGQGADPERQEHAHAHSVNPAPDGRLLVAADLGTDRLMLYDMDAAVGTLSPHVAQPSVETPPGEGPRHVCFSAGGRRVYVATELRNHLLYYEADRRDGTLRLRETLPLLPEGFTGWSAAADIHLTPDGRWLFVSNRGCDGLSRFAVDPQTGAPRPDGFIPGDGRWPRHFCIGARGDFIAVAYQQSDNVVIRALRGGEVRETLGEVSVPSPVCVAAVED